MERQLTRENTWPIFQMLTEMARGNFSYKIPRGGYKDQLEAIYEQLNMTAQELRENFKHLAYVNPHLSYRFIINSVIILDENEIIVAYSSEEDPFTQKLPNIIGRLFKELLSKKSQARWEKIYSGIYRTGPKSLSCNLEFHLGNELLMPQECYVGPLTLHEEKRFTSISFFQNRLQDDDFKKPSESKKLSKWDIIALQEVYDYLLQRVDQPKPSNNELARKFKLNEYRLKRGFLQLFGFTPLQYYNILRLEEAKTRIVGTYQTLEVIASDLNYKSYPHFSEAFKKHFGHPPSYYRS